MNRMVTPSSFSARRRPRWAASLNDLSPSPPTSNTSPTHVLPAQLARLERPMPTTRRSTFSATRPPIAVASPRGTRLRSRLFIARSITRLPGEHHGRRKDRVLWVEDELGRGEKEVVPEGHP